MKKNTINVYFFMILMMILIALIGNFLAKEYFVFLGVFIQVEYMRIFLLILILMLLILSVLILMYELNKLRLFINNKLRHQKSKVYLISNMLFGAIFFNSLINTIVGFSIKNDLLISFVKTNKYFATFGGDPLFVSYIINNILICIVSLLLLIKINNKKE